MREIRFRGQTEIGKKFVTGHLVYWGGNYQIWETDQDGETHNYQVIPETVGQFTGLQDKNGVDIYEGDVVFFDYNYMGKVVVEFNDGKYNISGYVMSKSSVIGNIYEHPHLIKTK